MPSNSILNIKKDGEWIGIPALKGEDGFSPTATVEKVGKVATITITDINGTTSATIADGTSSGGSGEENTIESISVNGTPISVDENKNVDITVPSIDGLTKDADLATVAKSGSYEDLSNKPTIPSLDGYAKTSEIPSKVSELTNDSNYQTAEQVSSTVTTEIAKVVADAPEDLNTLKEMSDWIAGHEDDASAMNSAIQANKSNIATLQTDKVDKETGKSLLADTDKANYDDAVSKAHSHENKSVLDGITSDKVTAWDNKSDFSGNYNDLSDKPTIPKGDGITITMDEDGTLHGNASVTVDSELSDTSENPVQNKVVKGVVDELKQDLTQLEDDENLHNAELQILGWNVPHECPIQNYVDSNGVFHQRVGRVDLGSLDWTKYESTNIYYAHIPSRKIVGGHSFIQTYSFEEFVDYTAWQRLNDKGYTTNTQNDSIYFRNDLYTSTTAFKQAMSGVYLYYELATEKTYTIADTRGLKDVRNITTNLLNPTLGTTESNGVTCTDNGDGTYTLNGTASTYTILNLCSFLLKKGTYKVIGRQNMDVDSTIGLIIYKQGTNINLGYDYKGHQVFTLEEDCYVDAKIGGYPYNFNNMIVKPMLTTNLEATYDDFVPYTGSTGSINGDVAQLAGKCQGWELIGSVTGANSVAIDSTKYGEFYISQKYETTICSRIVISLELSESKQYYIVGGYNEGTLGRQGVIGATTTAIINQYMHVNGTDNIAQTTMTVYGRR